MFDQCFGETILFYVIFGFILFSVLFNCYRKVYPDKTGHSFLIFSKLNLHLQFFFSPLDQSDDILSETWLQFVYQMCKLSCTLTVDFILCSASLANLRAYWDTNYLLQLETAITSLIPDLMTSWIWVMSALVLRHFELDVGWTSIAGTYQMDSILSKLNRLMVFLLGLLLTLHRKIMQHWAFET